MKVLILIFLTMLPLNSYTHEVDSLNWLQGEWRGNTFGQEIEEYFTGERGGVILGVNRIASQEALSFFEFMEIKKVNNTLTFIPYVFGKKGVSFPLKEASKEKVVFENLLNEFPKTITYELKSEGFLVVTVEGQESGSYKKLVFELYQY